MAEIDLAKHIATIAPTISRQQLRLAYHRPKQWAEPTRCFENVDRKVSESGGGILFGWTFHHRFAEAIPGPGYLYVTHHAVWHEPPKGMLVDVTPYPDPKHRPLWPGGDTLFLLDDNARPIRSDKLIAPLLLRFFPLGDVPHLIAHVDRLNKDEQQRCREIYRGENLAARK